VANLYIQDFLTKGYTTEFSFHYNRDDASIHYDDNGFLVRPAPVGTVVTERSGPTTSAPTTWVGPATATWDASTSATRSIRRSDMILQTIAGRRVSINARMAALELSIDKDWARYRASFFYASGDSSNRSGASRTDSTAHGFDSIVDDTHFAGSDFSFWDHEGIA